MSKKDLPAFQIDIPSSVIDGDYAKDAIVGSNSMMNQIANSDNFYKETQKAYATNLMNKAIQNQHENEIETKLNQNLQDDFLKIKEILLNSDDITASKAKELINNELIDKYKQTAIKYGAGNFALKLNERKKDLTDKLIKDVILDKAIEDASPVMTQIIKKYNSDPTYATTKYSKDINDLIDSISSKYAGDDDVEKLKLMTDLKKELSIFDKTTGDTLLSEYKKTLNGQRAEDELVRASNFIEKNREKIYGIVNNSKTRDEAYSKLINLFHNGGIKPTTGLSLTNKLFGGETGLINQALEYAKNIQNNEQNTTEIKDINQSQAGVGSEQNEETINGSPKIMLEKAIESNIKQKASNMVNDIRREELLRMFDNKEAMTEQQFYKRKEDVQNNDKGFSKEILDAIDGYDEMDPKYFIKHYQEPDDVKATILSTKDDKYANETDVALYDLKQRVKPMLGELSDEQIQKSSSKIDLITSDIKNTISKIDNKINKSFAYKEKYFKGGTPTKEYYKVRNKKIAKYLDKMDNNDIFTVYFHPEIITNNNNIDDETKQVILGYVSSKYKDVFNKEIKKLNLTISEPNPEKTLATIKTVFTLTNNNKRINQLKEIATRYMEDKSYKAFLDNEISNLVKNCKKDHKCPMTDISKIKNFDQLKVVADYFGEMLLDKELKNQQEDE